MNKDLVTLTKYPEFYALKQELVKFCDKLDNIQNIDITTSSRLTLSEEIFGRRYASDKIRDLLSDLGLLENIKAKQDRTFE